MSFQDLLDDPTLPRIVLVEVMPYDSGGATERRIGFSSNDNEKAVVVDGFLWEARLLSSFSAETSITNSGFDIGGFASPTLGRIDIAIGDTTQVQDDAGVLRDLLDLNWDGRDLVVYMGELEAAFGAYGVLFSGTVEDVVWNESVFSLVLRDTGAPLDDPVQETVFAGSGGLEGGDDLKDEIKPLLYGIKINIAPVLVDSATQIYVVHDNSINAVLDVFDAGVQLTNAGDITTLSLPALGNWTPVGGEYITDLANGAIRVGAEPFGPLTMDAEGDDTGSYVNKAADVIQRIITSKSSLVVGDLDAASFTALNADESGPIGVYLTKRINTRQVIDQILKGIVAFGVARADGKIEVGKLKFATPAETIEEDDVVKIERKETSNPAWRVKINYKLIGVVQDDLAVNLPPNTANSPFNLFGINANVPHTGTTFAYYDKEPLVNVAPDLIIGDIISAGAWVTDPTSDVDNARIQMLFWNDAGAQQGSTAEGNFIDTAATATRTVVEGVAVPSGATRITVQIVSASGGADLDIQRAMLNRGTLALPFVEVTTPGATDTQRRNARTYVVGDGTDNRIVIADDPAWDIAAADAFTVEGETYLNGLSADQVIFGKRDSGATQIGWEVRYDTGDGTFRVVIDANGGGGGDINIASGPIIVVDRWYRIALTRSIGGVYNFYVDDVPDSIGTNTADISGTREMVFMDRESGSTNLDGRLQDVRIWDEERSAAQIAKNRHTIIKKGETNLLGLWRLDEGSGDTANNLGSVGAAGDGVLSGDGIAWGGPVGTGLPMVDTALTDFGNLQDNVAQDQGDGALRSIVLLGESGFAGDGDVITFDVAFPGVPKVVFRPGGITTDSGLTGDVSVNYVAENLTADGFTASFLLKELAGTPTLHTDTGAVSGATWDFEMEKQDTTPEPAWDNKYTYQFDATVQNYNDTEPASCTVAIYIKLTSGGAWLRVGQKMVFGDSGSSQTVKNNQTVTITQTGVTDFSGVQFAVHLESSEVPGSTVDGFDSVKYSTATAPSEADAVPIGASDIEWEAIWPPS